MKDTQFNVFFKNEEPSGSVANPIDPGGNLNPKEPDKPSKSNVGAIAGAFAFDTLKTGIQMGMSRVGQYTRNQVLQERINTATKLAGYSALAVKHPLIAGSALVFDLINSSLDYNFNARQEQSALSIQNKRYGNMNRSR